MMWFFGWVLIVLAVTFAVLLVLMTCAYDKWIRNENTWNIYAWAMAGCWVVGCLLLWKQHYLFLEGANILAMGKFLVSQFTGKRWG